MTISVINNDAIDINSQKFENINFKEMFEMGAIKNTIKKLLGLASASLLLITFFFGAANADKSGVIKIATHNWSSQLVGAEVIGELFKKVGEKVEYVSVDSQSVYHSMCDNIDIVHEIWESTFGAAFKKQVDAGCIEDLSTHNATTREDWWYPVYVEKDCPGLPDWKALNKCSSKFARTNSGGKGVFIGGPVYWLKHDAEKIEALGMNFIVKNTGSAGAIWAELDAAVEQKKPIVIFNWSPNFIEKKYEGKFVEFPKYDSQCTVNPSWGINPMKLYDCGNPAKGYLKLAVNKDFKKNHPKAYKVAKQINFSNSDINIMANYVDTGGLEISSAAQQWLKDHKSKWKNWVE